MLFYNFSIWQYRPTLHFTVTHRVKACAKSKPALANLAILSNNESRHTPSCNEQLRHFQCIFLSGAFLLQAWLT